MGKVRMPCYPAGKWVVSGTGSSMWVIQKLCLHIRADRGLARIPLKATG